MNGYFHTNGNTYADACRSMQAAEYGLMQAQYLAGMAQQQMLMCQMTGNIFGMMDAQMRYNHACGMCQQHYQAYQKAMMQASKGFVMEDWRNQVKSQLFQGQDFMSLKNAKKPGFLSAVGSSSDKEPSSTARAMALAKSFSKLLPPEAKDAAKEWIAQEGGNIAESLFRAMF